MPAAVSTSIDDVGRPGRRRRRGRARGRRGAASPTGSAASRRRPLAGEQGGAARRADPPLLLGGRLTGGVTGEHLQAAPAAAVGDDRVPCGSSCGGAAMSGICPASVVWSSGGRRGARGMAASTSLDDERGEADRWRRRCRRARAAARRGAARRRSTRRWGRSRPARRAAGVSSGRGVRPMTLGRVVEVEQQRADGVRPHRPDAVGEHEPAVVGLDGRSAVADLDRLPRPRSGTSSGLTVGQRRMSSEQATALRRAVVAGERDEPPADPAREQRQALVGGGRAEQRRRRRRSRSRSVASSCWAMARAVERGVRGVVGRPRRRRRRSARTGRPPCRCDSAAVAG